MAQPPSISWVKYHPQQVLVSLLGLSPRAELAHRRFCDLVWSSDQWPDSDERAAAQLARIPRSAWASVYSELRRVGWVRRGNFLTNRQVAQIRRDAQQLRRNAVSRGCAGGAASASARGPQVAEVNPSGRIGSPKEDTLQSKLKGSPEHLEIGPSASREEVERLDVKRKDSSKALNNAERSPLSVSARKGKAGAAEQRFLTEVREVLGAASPQIAQQELANWGGWWRNRFRENAPKAARVLAEIRGMILERRVHTNPGAAASDLWRRLP
jgi:hypothetical protein